MRMQISHRDFELVERSQCQATIDLVVPFTTPELTQAALDSANRMSAGLNATIRLVKVQVVPFPLDLSQPPVRLNFLRDQLKRLRSERPPHPEIRLARDAAAGLMSGLKRGTIVVLAFRKRLWRTREQILAARLLQSGYETILFEMETNHA